MQRSSDLLHNKEARCFDSPWRGTESRVRQADCPMIYLASARRRVIDHPLKDSRSWLEDSVDAGGFAPSIDKMIASKHLSTPSRRAGPIRDRRTALAACRALVRSDKGVLGTFSGATLLLLQITWCATSAAQSNLPQAPKPQLHQLAQVVIPGLPAPPTQSGLTWEQVKAKFEAANPVLKSDQSNVDEMKAEEITAYLRPIRSSP